MEKVIVCVEQCYSDNNGAFDVVYEWNGECVETRTIRDGDYEVVSVNASVEQKVAAGDWMQINSKDVNVRNGVATYIGFEVILKRSRKAPNGKPLVVYHGTKADFSTFSLEKFGQTDGGWAGEGFYFAPNPAGRDRAM